VGVGSAAVHGGCKEGKWDRLRECLDGVIARGVGVDRYRRK